MEMIKCNANLVAAAAGFAATNDIRYYLNGICFQKRERGGVFVIATNGHTLFAGLDSEGEAPENERILPIDKATIRFAAVKASDTFIWQDNRVTVHRSGQSHHATCEPVDGKFPDWQAVLPVGKQSENPTTIDPLYLGQVAKAAKLLEAERVTVTTRELSATSVCYALPDPDLSAYSVVMPLRPGNGKGIDDTAAPYWA